MHFVSILILIICPGSISKHSVYLFLYPTWIIGITRVAKHLSLIYIHTLMVFVFFFERVREIIASLWVVWAHCWEIQLSFESSQDKINKPNLHGFCLLNVLILGCYYSKKDGSWICAEIDTSEFLKTSNASVILETKATHQRLLALYLNFTRGLVW